MVLQRIKIEGFQMVFKVWNIFMMVTFGGCDGLERNEI